LPVACTICVSPADTRLQRSTCGTSFAPLKPDNVYYKRAGRFCQEESWPCLRRVRSLNLRGIRYNLDGMNCLGLMRAASTGMTRGEVPVEAVSPFLGMLISSALLSLTPPAR